jgi:hypothetical protein
MPIVNIIDRRKRRYRFMKINAIVEAASHDNGAKDSDQIDGPDQGPAYLQREHISLAEAIIWGGQFPAPVTLFIYDEDGGIYPHPVKHALTPKA